MESVLQTREGKEGDDVNVVWGDIAPATETTKEDVAELAYPERWE